MPRGGASTTIIFCLTWALNQQSQRLQTETTETINKNKILPHLKLFMSGIFVPESMQSLVNTDAKVLKKIMINCIQSFINNSNNKRINQD
jgi:hypothetical protein